MPGMIQDASQWKEPSSKQNETAGLSVAMTNPLRSQQDLREPIEPRKLSDASHLLLEMQWSVSSERVKESSLTDVQVAEVTEVRQCHWWPELL